LGKNKDLKIVSARNAGKISGKPGEVAAVCCESFSVYTGDGTIDITEVQPSGKRVMSSREFLAGNKLNAGDTFI
jgi:methionyl-tRNA formyltransferase